METHLSACRPLQQSPQVRDWSWACLLRPSECQTPSCRSQDVLRVGRRSVLISFKLPWGGRTDMGPHNSHERLSRGLKRCHHAKAVRNECISCLLISATKCFGILVKALKDIECLIVSFRTVALSRHRVQYNHSNYADGRVRGALHDSPDDKDRAETDALSPPQFNTQTSCH